MEEGKRTTVASLDSLELASMLCTRSLLELGTRSPAC